MQVRFMTAIENLTTGATFTSDVTSPVAAYMLLGMDPRVENTKPAVRLSDGAVVDLNHGHWVTVVALQVIPA